MKPKSKLVILDRDGVINYDSNQYIKSPSEWRPIPNSLIAIAKLKKAGFIVAVATNQSAIARQLCSEPDVQAIHKKMHAALAEYSVSIDSIEYCPHLPNANCSCRKPQPGMLQKIAKEFNINPWQQVVPFVGDAKTDLLAARAADMLPVLVRTGKGQDTVRQINKNNLNACVYTDLLEFACSWI